MISVIPILLRAILSVRRRRAYKTLALLAAAISQGACGAPLVTNVVAAQIDRAKTVFISYDLAHSEGLFSTVTVEVTENEEYWVSVSGVLGDVGVGVTAGIGKSITWDAGSEWPERLFPTVKVRVRADDGQISNGGDPVPEGYSRIPAGSFMMGSPENERERSSDEGLHEATITRSFLMGKTEVSWSEWMAVRDWALSNGYTDLPTGRNGLNGDESGTHPVTTVTWFGAVKWLNAKSEMEGLIPCYTIAGEIYRTGLLIPKCSFIADGYRLPTEAEWEFACRAGSLEAFYTGEITVTGAVPLDPNLNEAGWYSGNSQLNTHRVGDPQKQDNDFGLRDMHGNVVEWCWDWYGPYPTGSVIDPTGAGSGKSRTLRGGGFMSEAHLCRSANRNEIIPGILDPIVGFRIVKTISE